MLLKTCLRNLYRKTVKKWWFYSNPTSYLKKRIWHKCFPVNFTKFLRTSFFTENLRYLLLIILQSKYSLQVLVLQSTLYNLYWFITFTWKSSTKCSSSMICFIYIFAWVCIFRLMASGCCYLRKESGFHVHLSQ